MDTDTCTDTDTGTDIDTDTDMRIITHPSLSLVASPDAGHDARV